DHRALANDRALEVARLGHFGLKAHIAPMVVVKETLKFLFVQRFVGIGPEWDAAAAVTLPDRVFGENYRHVAHESLLHAKILISRAGYCRRPAPVGYSPL